jgi:exopolysaccharide production protein ExoQ
MNNRVRSGVLALAPQRREWLASAEPRLVAKMSALGWLAGFFFASRIIAVFLSARWLNIGTEPGVVLTFGSGTLLILAALARGVGPSTQPMMWLWQVWPLRWVGLFITFSGLSLMWTGAASPVNSALYWLALVGDVLLVVLIFRGSEASLAAHSVIKGFVSGSCVLAVIAWVLPPAEDLRLGDLEYFNTNQIGNLCALSLFLYQLLASRTQVRWRLAPLLLAVTLFRSLSKATLVAFVASQAFRLSVDRSLSRRKKALVVTCAVVVTLAFWGLLESYLDIYSNAGNQAETLTGRTAIWAWSLDAALSRPWFGNGIDAMWKVAPPFGGELFEARHAENELLQQFFAYGVLGVTMLIGTYTSLCRQFRRMSSMPGRTVLTSLLIFVVVRGVAEAEPFDLLMPLWMITTMALLVQSSKLQEGRALCYGAERAHDEPIARRNEVVA